MPWRPITLRPLIRTNSGSAPILYGTLQPGAHDPNTNPYVYVPAGAIYSVADGGQIANNILNPATNTASVSLLPGQIGVSETVGQAFVGTSTSFWSYPSNCVPCNLLNSPSSGVGTQATTLVTKTLYNAAIQYKPTSSVAIRRMKYTPYNTAAVAAALKQFNSWAPTLTPTSSTPNPTYNVVHP